MGKKIIVAGAGHGGLPAAARLAKAGFDVTVYEKGAEGSLGYDWTDIFAKNALTVAGLEEPSSTLYEPKEDMTFYSTDCKTALRQNVPMEEREIKMERKDLYRLLLKYAEKCGVKFEYDCEILGPVLCGSRVVGIKTAKGDFYADLVIDAAGMESPVRSNLPAACGIQNSARHLEQFYVYRAFYNRGFNGPVEDLYKVYLLPEKKLGIGWVATEREYTDLLIGRFDPFDMEEAKRSAEYFRKDNPSLGDTLVRGGQFTKIPVRQPLSVMVCDGYAAIGDSAFMTVPLIGSGISNSLKASKMLAETVLADKNEAFSAETLWDYQVRYYKEIGAGLAPLACVKLLLTKVTPEQIDYIFAKHILSADNLKLGSEKSSLSSMLKDSPAKLLQKGKALAGDKDLLKKLLWVAGKIAATTANTASIPKKWNRDAVFSWAKRYDDTFIV